MNLIVKNFWKAWSWQIAALGLVVPELLQVLADHTALIHSVDQATKDTIRLVALLGVAVLRPIQQKGVD